MEGNQNWNKNLKLLFFFPTGRAKISNSDSEKYCLYIDKFFNSISYCQSLVIKKLIKRYFCGLSHVSLLEACAA
jgi:hypothetical protein